MDQVEEIKVKEEVEQENNIKGQHHNGFRRSSGGILVPSIDPSQNQNQMTIFCDGSVCVFDNITPDKAQAIMLIAAATTAASRTQIMNMTTPKSSQSSNALPATPHSQSHPAEPTSLSKLQRDLPIARRNSLQRFLEKRRERKLVNKSPYTFKKEPDSPGQSLVTQL